MDDYIKLLKNEMNLLDDKNKGQELRKDLKIENLNRFFSTTYRTQ